MIISTLNQTAIPPRKPSNFPALYMSNSHGHVVMFLDNCSGVIVKQGSHLAGVGVTIYGINGCTNEQNWRKLPPEEQIVLHNVD